jgi:hypothetical protein
MAPVTAVSQPAVKKKYGRSATQAAIPDVGSLICDVSTIGGRQGWSSLNLEDTQIVVPKYHGGIFLLDLRADVSFLAFEQIHQN